METAKGPQPEVKQTDVICLNEFTRLYDAAITNAVRAIETGDAEEQFETTNALGLLIDDNPVNFRNLTEQRHAVED